MYLYSSSKGTPIKKWLKSDMSLITTFQGHSQAVRKVVLFNNQILSSSKDGSVIRWDSYYGTVLQTYLLSNTSVWDVVVYRDDTFIHCSEDLPIQEVSISGTVIRQFIGHTKFTRRLLIHENYLFSASRDTTAKQWDLETGLLVRTFYATVGILDSVAVIGPYVLVNGLRWPFVQQFNLDTGDFIRSLIGHENATWPSAVNDGCLFTGSIDGTVRMWNVRSGLETLITKSTATDTTAYLKTTTSFAPTLHSLIRCNGMVLI